MRMLLHVRIPNAEFNAYVRDGSVGERIKKILEETKPEAAYFTECAGQRGATLVVDVTGPSDVPRLAEPWFLTFNAQVEFRVAMTPDDLGKANLEKLGTQWA
jgi:hypothetical protein